MLFLRPPNNANDIREFCRQFNEGILLDLAASRRSLGQREMSSIIVVVTDVLIQRSLASCPKLNSFCVRTLPYSGGV
jgi:hypothetical protein